MSMIMLRSWADCHGYNWPREWAYKIDGNVVTYQELLDKKRERQRRHLENIRANEIEIKPCYVWTFHNPYFPFAGWWLYVLTSVKNRDFEIGFRDTRLDKFITEIMREFPLGFLPIVENFRAWKKEFARIYYRPSKKNIEQGMALAWCKIEKGQLERVKRKREDL